MNEELFILYCQYWRHLMLTSQNLKEKTIM